MMTICACLWLGLFPLLQFGTYETITYNKWTVMLVLVCLTVILLLVSLAVLRPARQKAGPVKKTKKEPSSSRPPIYIAAALAGWILLADLCSPHAATVWFFGSTYRMEGLLSQLCYLGLFFLFAFSRVRRKPVMISAAAGLAVFCAVVLLQRAGVNVFGLYPLGRNFENAPDFQGTIGNIDMDTGYLCLLAGLFLTEFDASPASLVRDDPLRGKAAQNPGPPESTPRSSGSAGVSGRKMILRLLYLFLLLGALGLSVYLIVTMDVQFGAVTLAALALITLLRHLPRKLRIPVLIVLLAAALAVVWYWPGQSGGLWELKEILHGRAKLSFGSNRLAVWTYSLKLAPEQLLLGSGSDTFSLSFNRFIAENNLVIPRKQNGILLPHVFDNPHNEYIAHLINHGLPAALLFIALIVAAAFFRRKDPRSSLLKSREDRLRALSPWGAAVLCYAVQAFFSFSVPLVAPMFWVVMGICAGDDVP